MATTTTERGRFIDIIWTVGLTNWVFEDELNDAFVALGMIKVKSIAFYPSGADVFQVREGSITGPPLMKMAATGATDEQTKYFGDKGTWITPYIVAADQTFAVFGNVRVTIELA